MFWKLTALSASSPVDAILDKDNFTLEELLDEEEIIQECKALNSRLINFLRDRAQVEQLLRYVVEEPPEDADSKRTFKFPFVASEVFTCEIDVILRTLVEEEEMMDFLFSFLEPNRSHSALLAGYFSKVVVCLMLRKTVPLMNYVQAHQDVFQQLVDLIGITSIMEVLVRLVGADDHVYPNYMDVMRWLADSNLLEMIVDKLSPSCPSEVQANAAETLCAITRNMGSPLAAKLSSPSFVERIFAHALEDSSTKSCLVHSLSVCISLLDPRRSTSSLLYHSLRGQHMYEAPIAVNPDTVSAMIPRLGDLLMLLNVTSDEKILPTPYGFLRPPLGKHRLKVYFSLACSAMGTGLCDVSVVEFIAVLLKAGNQAAEEELVNSGTIKRVLDLFFEYPYNNALHHHVESIISSCLESRNDTVIDHLFKVCDLIRKILDADKHPMLSSDRELPTVPAVDKKPPRVGNVGHITRIANKIVQLGQGNRNIQTYIQETGEWNEWHASVLQERNVLENVYRWACGRPTALHDRTRDSDDDDLHDRDYDVAALANNLSQAFRPDLFGNEGAEEDNGAVDRDDEDVYFDDESAEVVISSLRLGDDKGSLFTNSNWFTFKDERTDDTPVSTSLSDAMDDINLNGIVNGGNSSSDDEVVVGEDEELADAKDSTSGPSSSEQSDMHVCGKNPVDDEESKICKVDPSFGAEPVVSDCSDTKDQIAERPGPDWVNWGETSGLLVDGSSTNPFVDHVHPVSDCNVDEVVIPNKSSENGEVTLPNGTSRVDDCREASANGDLSQKPSAAPSLFEEDVEFVGVEPEGTEKAMEQALKEGIVGEAGPLKKNVVPSKVSEEKPDEGAPGTEFNDANYWKVEQEVSVLE
uniref:SIT4 phosphatase-associated family protein n=1 Tax=Chenopodium quinoa TaxID=63459 RepID=A0A803N8K9_CHEQI